MANIEAIHPLTPMQQGARDYWQQKLAGFTAPTAIPIIRQPERKTADYREATFTFSLEQTLEINRFVQAEGVTFDTLVQAAWAILLSRYSGENDVVFGVTTLGCSAPVPGIETINTLPLRVRPEGVLSTLLHAVDEQQQQDNRNACASPADIRSWGDIPDGVALFDSIIVFENYPVGDALEARDQLPSEISDIRSIEYTNYLITLIVLPGESLSLKFIFDQSRIVPESITCLLGHMEVLLGAMVRETEIDVCQLPILTQAERQRILVEWNDTKVPYPADKCVHDLFEEQVAKSPDAIAVIFEEEKVSYSELNERANRLAHRLGALGIGPEVLVGLFVERSVEMVAGLLAILKAGGAYVPLDPEYPADRLAFMAEDADLKVLLCHGATRERVPECAARTLDMDEDAEGIAGENSENPTRLVGPDNLAYVIYTSGSTGKPKGVMVEHRNVLAILHGFEYLAPSGVSLIGTSITPSSFDVSVWEFFSNLCFGGTLHVLHREQFASSENFSNYLVTNRITCTYIPPALLSDLVVRLENQDAPIALERILVGVEPIQQGILQRLRDISRDMSIINGYGPTETTICATLFDFQEATNPERRTPIGTAVANYRIFLTDANLQPVPIGVPGELYIGGAGVARGYLNRPELTAEKFIPDPFSDDPKARLYRTGDLCRWLPDGNIEYLGRIDTQVKIRGFRVECGEVENALLSHPDVREAVVDARGEGADKQLVAWLVGTDDTIRATDVGATGRSPVQGGRSPLQGGRSPLQGGRSPSVRATGGSPVRDELRTYLRGMLPDWMVPSVFVFLDALPLTPSGKIDRRALPAPEASDSLGTEYVAPISPTEELLAGLWAAVLKRESIGRFDNFFDLGGHSLLATQLTSRVRDSFQVELPLQAVFEHPELSTLAEAISSSRQSMPGPGARDDNKQTLPPIEAQPADAPKVLSFAQQRLWFLDRYEGGSSSTYNIPTAMRFEGALDVDALQSSLHWMVERHESLRMTFPERDGEAGVVVLSTADFEFPIHDLRHSAPTGRQLQQRIDEHAARPFDLARGPLFRAEILQFAKEDEQAEDGRAAHVLLINMHHIISDGWSMGVFIREWRDAYIAFAGGHRPTLAPLPIQYSDYAYWQRQWLQGEVLEQQSDYWREALEGIPELLALPTDYPRPAQLDYRGSHYSQILPTDITAAIKDLSREQGVTLFMTLLAAFDVLLSRYSGQDDICVGSPIANRTRTHTENLIGFFVNTLVLRTRPDPDQGFRELLQQVRQTCLDAYAHQDIPFETLVEQLNPARSLGHSPLFQVMLALQNYVPVEMELPGLTTITLEQAYPIAKFDLTLFVEEQDGQLCFTWEYATSLFTEQTIQRMGEHFQVLLRGIVAEPETPISQLPLLSEAERRRILVEWNDTKVPYPQDKCVHELFEEQVARFPDAVAVVFEDEKVSYGELNDHANRLAHRLRALGVGPEVLVGLFVERSVEMVVGILAILKAGGAYVPLDPEYPRERLAIIAEDADLKVLLCHGATREQVPECAARIFDVDMQTAAIAGESAENPTPITKENNLAYVIYTSGSTGQPKGCANEHKGIVNRILWMQDEYRLTQEDAIPQKTPFSFDVSVWEFLWPLMAGARLVVARPGGHKDPVYLADLINAHDISVMHFVPSMLSAFLDGIGERECPSLRDVICSGEALTAALQERFFSAFHARLHNLYGPTEAAIDVSYWQCRKDSSLATVPIGRPIANTQLYILDPHGHPVPISIPGELYIGGVGVARGYLNRPDLTTEKFIPDPFSDDPKARLYRTGDLCRWLPDGNIEFLGRMDTQVKIRGFRIECGEVENALLSHPDVREVAVDVRGEGTDKQLVAWLVGTDDTVRATDVGATGRSPVQGGRSPVRDELRAHLRRMLPDWMVPSVFVFVDALPLTPSGKIDRRALPAPEASDLPGTEYIAPISPTEELLAQLWSVLLKREPIGRFDNFFDLGGHSLLATQLISRIRDNFDVELPVRVVFEHPELSTLAEAISSSRQGMPGPSARDGNKQLLPIEAQPADAPKVLSFAQQRLWILNLYEGGRSATYNMPVALRFSGPLDIHALQASLQWMVERHESLRMTFPDREGVAYVEILPASSFEFPIRDLRHLSLAGQSLQQRIDENATRPFDLARGPLFRAEILQLAEEDGQAVHVLLLNMHHIISDGWSMAVFVREWRHAYIAFAGGDLPTLAPLPIQYSDYAAWQRQWLQGEGEILKGQLAWWKDNLAGIPDRLELPIDYPRPAEQDYRGNHYGQVLGADITAALNALSRAQGATLFMTLLAAFDILLSRYSGQDDICVGFPIANRAHAHTENLIGFFFNTLVLRTRLNPEQGFRELLQQARQTCLEAYAHQDIPFETLLEQLKPTRALGHSPLFQAVLNLQNNASMKMEWPGLTITTLEHAYPIAKLELTLFVEERDGQLHCTWEYATSLFTIDTIRRMGEHFEVLLRSIVEDPEQPISRLPLLTEAERQRILVEWNDTTGPVSPALLHDLFVREAQRRPDAPALIAPGIDLERTLTYGELLDLAKRTAHWLQRHDVAPNTLVAVVMEKCWEQVVAVLGILMAGGAYLPIDAHLPAARRNDLLTDGEAHLALTQPQFSDLEWPDGIERLVIANEELAREEPVVAETARDPEDLAYVIYTSGSTGKPKGVMIDHRGAVNTILDINRRFSVTEEDRVLCLSALNFDLSVYDIFGVLAAGGVLVIPEEAGLRDPAHWRGLMVEHGITLWDTVPALKQMLVEELESRGESRGEPAPPGMRLVMMSGDWIPLDLPGRIRALWPEVEVIGLGGATEASIWSNFYPIEDIHPDWKSIPYGKPLTNQFFRVLDSHLEPCPVRVSGDLYIGGIGLAKGYWNDPAKTDERFITHPVTGERLYRTGDLGRYLPDGNLEFLGRSDFQVKIRGRRIELGEIEAVLTSHPAIREAVVTAVGEERNLQSLAAYIVPLDPGQSSDKTSEEFEGKPLLACYAPQPHVRTSPMPDNGSKIDKWQQTWDYVYDQLTDIEGDIENDPKFNITGWNSSYTGELIPREEMQEWLDGTVERILSNSPKRVLEIGCGTGMLVFRIAPYCEHYTATDFSSRALGYIKQQKETWEFGERIKLLQQTADNFDGVEEGLHDAIILNSVIQYFPSVDYLITVLTGAVTALAPGGFIFIGDVRNFQLMEEFHASVQLHQADDSVSLAELKQRVRQGMGKDNELLIDPDFFIALTHFLPRITHVGIQLKSGHARNEMTCFRYDVTLYIDAESSIDRQFQRFDWQKDELTLARVREILVEEQPERIEFENVPNARLLVEKKVAEELISAEGTVGDLRASIRQTDRQTDNGIEPGAFHALTHDLPYTSSLDYRGKYDYSVLFRHRDSNTPPYFERSDDFSPEALHTYANNPLQGAGDGHELIPQLRDFLQRKLPDYMVPSLFVQLDFLPLTQSGKIDRKALPAPEWKAPVVESIPIKQRLEQANEEEYKGILVDFILGRFANILRVNPTQLDIEQPLKTMGLDSLMAIEFRNEIRMDLNIEISLTNFMEDIDVSELARQMEIQLREIRACTSPSSTDKEQMLAKLESGQLSDEEIDALFDEYFEEAETSEATP
uniref:Amino acid adenylation domain-containing protein n=1 Tax=Candidatus Kentrum sp. FW TaxID=2126338 RepID=A0A450SLA4_9GAMM|nr:MAG: amino acid adenylation domain-containing protein [Candidatus Kentron sp. FW]